MITVTVDGISVPVNQTRFGEVSDLPDPRPDTIYQKFPGEM